MRELVELNCDVIVTTTLRMTREAARATTTVPIVSGGAYMPVETGLVASLARPGGNITGYAHPGPEIVGKKLELFKETMPKVRRVAVLSSRAI
jgi:putative ABC transport system substrate-binding protein